MISVQRLIGSKEDGHSLHFDWPTSVRVTWWLWTRTRGTAWMYAEVPNLLSFRDERMRKSCFLCYAVYSNEASIGALICSKRTQEACDLLHQYRIYKLQISRRLCTAAASIFNARNASYLRAFAAMVTRQCRSVSQLSPVH